MVEDDDDSFPKFVIMYGNQEWTVKKCEVEALCDSALARSVPVRITSKVYVGYGSVREITADERTQLTAIIDERVKAHQYQTTSNQS
jgi:hypothetical protein